MGLLTKDGDIGYYPLSDKHVCSDCFGDECIKGFIESQAESLKCDFCGKESSEPIAADINEVIEYILDCVSTEWGNPDDEGVPVEGGEYVWPVTDSYDLFLDEIQLDANPDVTEAIIQACVDRLWVKRDYRTADLMLSGWALFIEEIKHHRRYFFSLEEDDRFSFDILPSKFLDGLGKEISELELIRTLTTSDIIYRVRIHDPNVTLSTAAELGSPPTELALYPNRMSPAGIPMFYGSFDINTAIIETYKPKKNRQSVATIGKFKPRRKLIVLDLTSLPEVPSIFDEHRGYLRPTIMFLSAFVEELRKPVEKDDKAHIEYVPTQVFTEYIRHAYKFDDDIGFEGIIYPSAINPSGISCVLFVENDDCYDKGAPERKWKPYILALDDVERRTIT